jgi:RNA polymerase sigma-70 factor (ECF subfamily)
MLDAPAQPPALSTGSGHAVRPNGSGNLLERKLDELPENFRIVFLLRSIEDMTVDETAGCLEISGETVRSRHFRVKACCGSP